ncbi:cytochrome P450 CYP749A22-like [Argentina anserina]|uniref:cytochrome P450 CYP749A22-like n=1 Tax=Argentina anserina TaxID=57926 RepID=UPI0021763EE9|nr:cytochrome P450 CYP749A22-like [Potentilla anserina]
MEIVKEREEKARSGGEESFGSDFLGALLNAYHDTNDKHRFSIDDIVDECKSIYFAGQETVNTLLDWTMSMIVNEALRLCSPIIYVTRSIERNVRLGKLLVPAEVELIIPFLAIHHDDQLWGQDAHLFKPERFSEGVAKANTTNNNMATFLYREEAVIHITGVGYAASISSLALHDQHFC